jgi:hypothetical protein
LLYGEAELEDHLLPGDEVVVTVGTGPRKTAAERPVASFA